MILYYFEKQLEIIFLGYENWDMFKDGPRCNYKVNDICLILGQQLG